jgi:HD superfamily phosphohydrolase
MMIDVDRLLSGYTIHQDSSGKYRIAYLRGSLSVIENVIFANDLERRWVQNHPVILYDSMLSDFAIRYFDKGMKAEYGHNLEMTQTVFVKEALTDRGLMDKQIPLRLLCDDDIVYYNKNKADPTAITEQFFSRSARLKPLWKTEAIFNTYIDAKFGDDILTGLQDDLKGMLAFFLGNTGFFVNAEALSTAKKAYQEAEGESIGTIDYSYKRVVHVCELFLGFREEHKLPDFEFSVIIASKFDTIFRRIESDTIYIELTNARVERLDKLLSVTASRINADQPTSLFYVYTTSRNLQTCEDNKLDLGELFFDYFRKNYEKE